MFRVLGQFVSRYWPVCIVVWIAILATILWVAPDFKSVTRDGEFKFLPDNFPSRQGEALYRKAFSVDLEKSNIIVVARRESGSGLTQSDKDFILESLKPKLEKIAKENGDLISNIRTFDDRGIGNLLISEDNKATLIILELTSEYREEINQPTIEKIQRLLGIKGIGHRPSEASLKLPVGLDFSLSGSATVGRDMRVAAEDSASKIDWVTLVLVSILLLAIYRAPLPVFIPLLTVFISIKIALGVLSILADHEILGLFSSAKIYVTVVLYGAGVDYCMFLIARYKEELDKGSSVEEAIVLSVEKVGPALVASAGTTMAGIGMMMFAQFGKFQQAGLAMSMSLFFVLCTSLTFAPAFLRLSGKWAFWPRIRSEKIFQSGGWVSQTSFIAKLLESRRFQQLWIDIGQRLTARPGKIWIVCVLCLLPFAIIGVIFFGYLSFGLLSELPAEGNSAAVSVRGTRAVQDHFPAGATGPVTILWYVPGIDFTDYEDENDIIGSLTSHLEQKKQELKIADILSRARPFGITEKAKKAEEKEQKTIADLSRGKRILRNRLKKDRIDKHYLGQRDSYKNRVARIDVIFEEDPFSRNSILQFEQLKKTVDEFLPDFVKSINQVDEEGESLKNPVKDLDYEVHYIGSTPSITDLKTITNADQVRIDVLVIVVVFLILVILIRKPAISAYLILSVFFSYLVTLGVTYCVFWVIDPGGFAGLDWKVPMFLFTILIAVGEDYNIYLITRIDEEQKKHGPIKGITEALSKTGGIISSCGLIMAGTFSSLMTGSLAGMQQLGFALAFGVMLDTFVVRTVLVPAFLILLHKGRFGKLGKWMGASAK